MNLYLYSQKRNRDLEDYLVKLCVTPEQFATLNCARKRILLVGGGVSTTNESFLNGTCMEIVNIDYDPFEKDMSERIKNIKGNFYEVISDYEDYFEEIWALYSLPLYAPTQKEAMLFVYKTVHAVKNNGKVRFFPIENEKNNKMHTRDADYDITTGECREAVMSALKKVQKFGAKCEIIPYQNNKADRQEDTVLITVDCTEEEKEDMNALVRKECNLLDFDNKGNISKVNIMVDQN